MKLLLIGGSKSGKSHIAQEIVRKLANGGPMYYWATMEPTDDEDEERIRKHIEDRSGWGFETIECGSRLMRALPLPANASVLFDSVTALLANEMFGKGEPDIRAHLRVLDELLMLGGSVSNVVFVCDEIFRGGTEYDALTLDYMRSLALICRGLAMNCDTVGEASSGIVKLHKGSLP